MTNLLDLKGRHFGKWTVLEYKGKSMWLCRCECGVEKAIYRGNLLTGRTTQCYRCGVKNRKRQSPGRLPKHESGGIKGLAAIAKKYNIPMATLAGRMRRGCTVEEAINNYTDKRFKYYSHKDTKKYLSQWARKFGVTRQALDFYLRTHTFEEAYNHYDTR